MGTSRWVLIILGALAAGSAAVHIADRRAGGGDSLAPRGTLPHYRAEWTGGWEAAGHIPADALGTGEVLDVAEGGGATYVLQRDRWHRLVGGRAEGPHGWLAEGGPAALGRAVSLAVADGTVYVLDAANAEVRAWDTGGRHLGRLTLRPAPGYAFFRPEHVQVDADGRIHVSTLAVRADGAADWLLLRYAGGAFAWDSAAAGATAGPDGPPLSVPGQAGAAPDTLFRSPADVAHGVFAEPKYALSAHGQIILRVATDDELHWLDGTGQVSRSATRRDAPAWPVPDSIRAGYRQMLAAMPSGSRGTYELPAYFPSVRRLVARPTGEILVLLNAGAEDLHVEVLDAEGQPRGRLTETPQPEPLFVTPSRLYRIVHELDAARVEAMPFNIRE
jgi:hypothetical protein